jgi:hypothetical protein
MKQRLDRGVHVAPFVSLCRLPILVAIDSEGRLLASVIVHDAASEAATITELESLVRLYDGRQA